MVATGRVAVVTGASSGIGRASAIELAKVGFAVFIAGRRESLLHEVAEEGRSIGATLYPVVTDVSDRASIAQLFATIRSQVGRLDLLFNNAGIPSPKIGLEDLTEKQWTDVVATNLNGSFYCTQEAFNMMKEQDPMGGRIINNGSISAYVPRPDSAPYTVTKHAITGLTRQASLDGRKYNIACGQIDIGNAASDMTEGTSVGTKQADGSIRSEPRMDVLHVARAVSYMASLPLDANVQFMTVMASAMPYIGRG